jgi:K+-sensing histidine kinase KdpD
MTTKEMDVPDNFSDMLVSVLIHDLRQPFATFIATVDMIKHTRRIVSQEEIHMIFEDIRDMSSRSIGLLDGLLYWRKSQKAGFAYQPQPLLLRDLIFEDNSLYLYDQLNKNISLYNIITEDQIIYGHKQMLQFINRNILSNATKYSPPGGIIGITCSIDNERITVAFTDQGKGMTASEMEKLFHITEAAAAESALLKGAGIALSICRDMIHQMHGKLWAESVPDQGTTFYYSLPFYELGVKKKKGKLK